MQQAPPSIPLYSPKGQRTLESEFEKECGSFFSRSAKIRKQFLTTVYLQGVGLVDRSTALRAGLARDHPHGIAAFEASRATAARNLRKSARSQAIEDDLRA
jgi:hypothetical protein